MLDLSLCPNKDCPSRGTCYRYLAYPSEHRQSYSLFKPDKSGRCATYMDAVFYTRKRNVIAVDKQNGKTFNNT